MEIQPALLSSCRKGRSNVIVQQLFIQVDRISHPRRNHGRYMAAPQGVFGHGIVEVRNSLKQIEGWYSDLDLRTRFPTNNLCGPVDGTTLRSFDAQGGGECFWSQN